MKTWIRWSLAVGLLAAAFGGQRALSEHLRAAAPLPAVPLAQPLATLPMQLGAWQGQDEPIDDPRHRYADQHLRRIYVHPVTKQVVSVWGAFSGTGTDRGHHPEVCMAVAGQAEDRTVRTTLDLPGGEQPVQQYRFGSGGRAQWVFYWHYSMPAPPDAGLDAVQETYRRLHQRPASLTLEVFAPELGTGDVDAAREFVQLLDAAAQSIVGPAAVRGSRRLPVALVPDPEN